MNDLTPEKAKQLIESIGYQRPKLLKRKRNLQKDIIELTRHRGIMICRHNTILALSYNGKVSHIITQGKNERGMINLCDVDQHLSVPRYEPKVAKEWMSEELVLNTHYEQSSEDYKEMMSKYAKVSLGEHELRNIVLEDKRQQLEFTNNSLDVERQLTEIVNEGER